MLRFLADYCSRFPDLSKEGVAATKAIHDRYPDIRIIVLTSFKEREQVDGALKAGAMS
ncbi:response regulator transcription factor [Dehalogenimonas etheniformans]|uniref:response regulator transcription factor n=1 Tax=Dehalogenimonas etheniformans TaxID=1536648 RepID=UPI001392338A|nr:response regulator transcription factor [Dehalogenimonas etheniformans]QNT76125.1 hypothetical protein HX448_05165 [Dehalogenimonas etheniformans]